MSALATIAIISLFCNGWYLITRHGMILFFIHKWYVESCKGFIRSDGETDWMYRTFPTIPRFFYKPLFGCLPCMASIPGSICYWLICDSWAFYPVAIIGAACLNLIINQIYDK